MNRIKIFGRSLLIGTLLVGPAVFYAAIVALAVVGSGSRYYLTTFVPGILLIGAVWAVPVALVCAVVRCDPRPSALWPGGICFLVLGSLILRNVIGLGIDPGTLPALLGTVTVFPLASALMGYLIAVLTNRWLEHDPLGPDSAVAVPSFATDQRAKTTYILK